MKRTISNLNRKVFLRENFSSFSATLFSSILFFIASTTYAINVFVQFNVLQVISVSLAFLFLFLLLLTIFMPQLRKEKVVFSLSTIFWSFIVAIFLLVILNSPNTGFHNYFRTFPLLEAELGLGWVRDSAYHASIIQSFASFGFPSIGQHGTPFTAYHVLSHFVDAIIVRLTGVGVWESYGLFYFFKSVFFLISILFFISVVTLGKKPYIFILSLIFLTPIVVSTWHAIGSHGLWFTSLLIVLSVPWVFNTLTQQASLRNRHFLLLFLLFVMVSLGKISSGFMFAAFAGLVLLISRPKEPRVYVFGFSLVLFFVLYNSVVSYSRGGLEIQGLVNLVPFLLAAEGSLLWQIYLLILITGVISWLFSSRPAFLVFSGGALSILVLALIINIQPFLSGSDRYYFTYGLSSILILFVYQTAIWSLVNKKGRSFENAINFDHVSIRAAFAIVLMLATNELSSTRYSFFNAGPSSSYEVIRNAYSQPFAYLNGYDQDLQANMVLQFSDRNYVDLEAYDRPMKEFNKSLHNFMESNNLDSYNSLLFMPKEMIQGDIAELGGNWGRGMFVYSVTGVPMIHGIDAIRTNYGHGNYGEDALQISREEFDSVVACELGKHIIIAEDFETRKFSLTRC